MYLAKTIKTESGLYIYDALSNKFALVNSEQDLLDDKYYAGIEILYQKDPRYFKGNVNYNVVMYNGINRKLLESLEYLWKSDVTLIDLFETEYFKKSRDKSDEELSLIHI